MFKECSNCNIRYPFTTNGLCEFCRIVKINLKSDIFNYILCISDLSQLEIIKSTLDKFKKTNEIPTPEEVDPSCIKLALNPYIYRFNNQNNLNNYDNSIKIFYTNALDRNKLKIKKIGTYKTELLNVDEYCLNKKDINNIIKPSNLRSI